MLILLSCKNVLPVKLHCVNKIYYHSVHAAYQHSQKGQVCGDQMCTNMQYCNMLPFSGCVMVTVLCPTDRPNLHTLLSEELKLINS